MIARADFAPTLTGETWSAAAGEFAAVTSADVDRVLEQDRQTPRDLPILLAPAADAALERMAQLARRLTLQRFGRVVVLYVPLYVSSKCVNSCRYCGFRHDNDIVRHTLSPAEIEREMEHIRTEGFEHLLLVSGEHPTEIPVEYLADVVARAHRRFSSVAIEVYPLDEPGYTKLVAAGCDSLALYQETYDPTQYREMHPAGPKSNFAARLNAVSAAAAAGMRSLGLGALLGLSDWRTEGIFLGRHASYLMKHYFRSRIGFSFPRLCPAAGDFEVPHPVSDRDFVHLMCALRLAFPDAELVTSTRESPAFRDNLIKLGVATRQSAGSCTVPGGYTSDREAEGQFQIHDSRSPAAVAEVIARAGYEPVWKDWDRTFLA